MKLFYKLLLAFLLFTNSNKLFAADIIFLNQTNTAVKSINTKLDLDGKVLDEKLFFSFTNDVILKKDVDYTVYIVKKHKQKYLDYAYQKMPIIKGKKTAILPYIFCEQGDFIISVIDEKGFIVKEKNLTIN